MQRLVQNTTNKFLTPVPLGPTRVEGTKRIPVVTIRFKNTAAPPFPVARLQQELFDGPWPTGTMKQFYLENSYQALTVEGTVTPWATAANADTFYEGADFIEDGHPTHCWGTCADAKLKALFEEAVRAQGAAFDWGAFDNDGPDGEPNSGDDDGLVDFIAFVQPESGGECGTSNIWSHRSTLTDWGGAISTSSARKNGGKIRIDDYVVVPALACDGTTMIQIGVFAHEFGHAFGLPDLYDTNRDVGGYSAGVANWCLMGAGSWGGDGKSPERPVHMSPWSKAWLGWVEVMELSGPGTLPAYESGKTIGRLRAGPDRFYLLSNVQREGFDAKLPGSGLAIWEIREDVLAQTLSLNTVNATSTAKGVNLLSADGLARLDTDRSYAGSAADLFPGSTDKRRFDSALAPKAANHRAVCRISLTGTTVSFDARSNVTSCSAIASPPQNVDAADALPAEGPRTEPQPDELPLDSAKAIAEQPDDFASRVVLLSGTLKRAENQTTLTADGVALPLEFDARVEAALRTQAGKRVEVLGVVSLKAGKPVVRFVSLRAAR
jgi:M6 family metalloprotease-like protein